MADSKKYNGSTWEHSLRKLTTATEAVENPLYSDGTAITSYTIKGNTIQSGTPSPSSPIPVNGVGELETTGEHSGEYKIPISSGGVTTNIYLGSTQTTRRIKKFVCDGTEYWIKSTIYKGSFYASEWPGRYNAMDIGLCTHLPSTIGGTYTKGSFAISNVALNLWFPQFDETTTPEEFEAYLATQYANGTPVTVWYVLPTPKTAAVNEPLMKIGDYSDTLSNAASIPTTEGANSITVDTTVQPSEFTATWTGWHDTSVKEWDGSDWQ